MTGYNHYSSCTCGWCVGSSRGRLAPGAVAAYFRATNAQKYLTKFDVRGVQSCFVNPNARCPVCKDPVYFYANSHGSRVYFDDLGPPWPKHPCTNNAPSLKTPYVAPKRRPLGEISDLVAAGHVLKMFKSRVVGVRSELEWSLLVILEVKRKGEKNAIRAEYLNSSKHERVDVVCHSAVPIFEVGEFLSTKDGWFSYFARHAMREVRFRQGWPVKIQQTRADEQSESKPHNERIVPASVKEPENQDPFYRAVVANVPPDLRRHFLPKRGLASAFLKRIGGIVDVYKQKGIQAHGAIASKLNNDRHFTAHGGQWNTKLVARLLKILSSKPRRSAPKRTGV